MIAKINSHKRDTCFNQSTCQQRLLLPEVLSVTLPHGFGLAGQIKCFLGTLAHEQIHGLLFVLAQCPEHGRLIELSAQ